MTIVERIKRICLKPKEEWQVIAAESTSTADLLKNYALPLAAASAVASFIGNSVVGTSYPIIGTIRVSPASGLAAALLSLVLALAGVYVLGLIIAALAPSFGAEKNGAQALKVAVYSATPGWAAGVLLIVPRLGVIVLLALCYGVYLLHLGLQQLMKTPPDKAFTYTAAVTGCAIGILLVGYFVLSAIGVGAVPTALPSGLG